MRRRTRRTVAARLEHFRERELLGAQEESTVVANAVLGGKPAGEEAGVGRQRQWSNRNSLLEEHATLGERIERRSLDVPGAVCADSVGPGSVERDEDEVQMVTEDAAWQRAEIDAASSACGAGDHPPPAGKPYDSQDEHSR